MSVSAWRHIAGFILGLGSLLVFWMLVSTQAVPLSSLIPSPRSIQIVESADKTLVWPAGVYLAVTAVALLATKFRALGSLGPAGLCLIPLMAPTTLMLFWPDWSMDHAASVGRFLTPTCFVLATGAWLGTLFGAVRLGRPILWVWAAVVLYTLTFGGLAWCQYEALHVPHGDSAMYEEHLWNLGHGKGFRSQIDDGRLFLGEHLEVIHVLLMPIYVLAPNLVTLQFCEAAALASGAWAIFLLARRFGAGEGASSLLAMAYLLYFPLQHLSLESSWKTFRPETLGVPILLWGLVALESRRRLIAVLLFLTATLAKEDYAITVAALGIWISVRDDWRWGVPTTLTAAGLLLFVVGWMIPWIRGGVPHYTAYFEGLGDSPAEVARRLVSEPRLFIDRLFTLRNGEFLWLMLLPLAFLPIIAPTRLAVAMPTFGYLMLSSLDALATPWFHFHAPLVPILFWATAAGVGRWSGAGWDSWLGRLACSACLITGVIDGRSPISWKFHDPYFGVPRSMERGEELFQPIGDYWRDVYLPTERSRAFSAAFEVVPITDRVAATDYVRGRFTHHAAAHVYPELKPHATMADINAIVIDRTEGWWGRGPTNPDRELLAALAARRPIGTRINVRGVPFEIVHHDAYFLVLRQTAAEASDE